MSTRDFLIGKWWALARLSSFIRYLQNWWEVWSAFRNEKPLPRFVLRNGLVLTCGPMDDLASLFREIFVCRCYTRGFYAPKPGDTVLDIGANVGVFTIFLRWLCPGVRVHAFEPVAETRERLEMNLRANHLTDSVTVHPVAVAAQGGTLTLFHGSKAGHSSVTLSQFSRTQQETVPCINLATALQLAGVGPIHLLKIDTEGSEVEIFEGIGPTVLDQIQRVVVEYHGLLRPGSRDLVARALDNAGFSRIEDVPDLPDGQLGLIRASRCPSSWRLPRDSCSSNLCAGHRGTGESQSRVSTS
jgi:FkbM family methyltransferase